VNKTEKGRCAKTHVVCVISTPSGHVFKGTNWCANPQEVCPRSAGEGYDKCKSICKQEGHAEVDALKLAGDKARGASAVLTGHSYACQSCQEALFGAGISSLHVEQAK